MSELLIAYIGLVILSGVMGFSFGYDFALIQQARKEAREARASLEIAKQKAEELRSCTDKEFIKAKKDIEEAFAKSQRYIEELEKREKK